MDKGVRDSHSTQGEEPSSASDLGIWEQGTVSSRYSLGTRLVAVTFILRDILVKEKHSTIICPVGKERWDYKKGAEEIQGRCALC